MRAHGARGTRSRLLPTVLIAAAALMALLPVVPAQGAAPVSGGGGIAPAPAPGKAPPPHQGPAATSRPHPRPTARPRPRRSGHPATNPLSGRAMWIWVLGGSEGGGLGALVQRAHQAGVATVIVKSGDGRSAWSQFNSSLVATLHANHLRVCAWQYLYGNYPDAEAQVGAASVAAGADCLVLDAESEYQGRYVQAQTFVADLRQAIGTSFPVALASLPYVDDHPAFPYSVFLGPGGAQYDAPQMYWQDIGDSVDAVYAHTYAFNRAYGRPIFPLGQLYRDPAPADVERFREVSRSYGATGVSWWDWQETQSRGWRAIAQPVGAPAGFTPYTDLATLGSGAQGDLVVWAQEHLRSAGEPVSFNGQYDAAMTAAVQSFQGAHGLAQDGLLGTQTWQALLRYAPAPVKWVQQGSTLTASAASGYTSRPPASARLPERADELRGPVGAGRPGAG